MRKVQTNKKVYIKKKKRVFAFFYFLVHVLIGAIITQSRLDQCVSKLAGDMELLLDFEQSLLVLRRPVVRWVATTFVHYVRCDLLMRRLTGAFPKELDAQHIRLVVVEALVEEEGERRDGGELAGIHTVNNAILGAAVSKL